MLLVIVIFLPIGYGYYRYTKQKELKALNADQDLLESTELVVNKVEYELQEGARGEPEYMNMDVNSVYYRKEKEEYVRENYQLRKDEYVSLCKLDLSNLQTTTILELEANQTMYDFAFYNDQLLYVYVDNGYHLVYGDEEIYYSEGKYDYINIYGNETIYVFIDEFNEDADDIKSTTIYRFDGQLEKVWGCTSGASYRENKGNRLIFSSMSHIYYEDHGTLECIKTDDLYTHSVVGDYIVLGENNNTDLSIYNMSTGKTTKVKTKFYIDGKFYDVDNWTFNSTYLSSNWSYDLGNNIFLMYTRTLDSLDIKLPRLFKGIIDEENGLIVFMPTNDQLNYNRPNFVYYNEDEVNLIVDPGNILYQITIK